MPAVATPPPIKVPNFKTLTAAPAPAAAEVVPAPEITPAPEVKPPAAGEDPPPSFETSIVQEMPKGTAPVGTPKAAADFKAERLLGKQQKQDFAQVQSDYDQAKLQLVQRDLDLEKLRKDLADREKALEDEKKTAADRAKELDDLRAGYFEQHRATWNPLEDTEFQTAQQTMVDKLRTKLPMRVPTKGADDQPTESRVFFDTILQQNGAPQGLANILDVYAMAKSNANEGGMNRAVNAMAQFLGATAVDMSGEDESKWKLLPASDPTFKQIETALDEATPFHVARTQRYAQVQKDGPTLARQQFESRETGIRQTLSTRIFLAPEEATKRLAADPNDGVALMGVLLSQVPALKEAAERKLREYAPAFAAMGDKLFLPGLASSNPAEIAAHRQREAQTRQIISEAMAHAISGAVMGPVLSSVIAERDDAEERAQAASLLTNPSGEGAAKAGKDGAPAAAGASIATEIVTGR